MSKTSWNKDKVVEKPAVVNVLLGKKGFVSNREAMEQAQKDAVEKKAVNEKCLDLGLTAEQLANMSYQEKIEFTLKPLHVYRTASEKLTNGGMTSDAAGKIFISGTNKILPDLSAVKSQTVDGKRITINWND